GNLVDMAAVGCFPVAPLLAIHRPEVAVLIRPLVPNADVSLLQPADIRVAAKKPERLDDYRPKMQLLGGQQGEADGEIESHLRAKQRQGAGTGTVGLRDSFVEHPLHQIEIGPHGRLALTQPAKAASPGNAPEGGWIARSKSRRRNVSGFER